jgi:hypothetical protein
MDAPCFSWLGQPATDFVALVDLVPNDVLASPRRSVVPLLEFWRDTPKALRQLEEACGLQLAYAADLHFEYGVPVQKGRGKPSYTDLLILTEHAIIGVEAKYTEPEYESVRAWLRDPRESNRVDVLAGWLELIEFRTSKVIDVEQVLDLPYQLIHRVASPCSVERAQRAVIYLVFGSAAHHYSTQMRTFAELLGDRRPVLAVMSCPFMPSAAYQEILNRWDAGERRLNHDMRSALRAGSLMTFSEIIVEYHSSGRHSISATSI